MFEQVEIGIKYAGYIARQEQQIKELRRVEAQRIPADIDYSKLTGLRLEAKEKLAAVRPENLGQAARISGVNPADVAALHIPWESLSSIRINYLDCLKNETLLWTATQPNGWICMPSDWWRGTKK